jgi:hypothetical protein
MIITYRTDREALQKIVPEPLVLRSTLAKSSTTISIEPPAVPAALFLASSGANGDRT